jgi:hypothetical protein
MSKRGNLLTNIRLGLILALIFLGSYIIAYIFGAFIITILSYFVISYRSKLKALEARQAGSQAAPAYVDSPAPPTSTDA